MPRPFDITLAGFVGSDPQSGQTATQKDFVRFRLACTPSKHTEDGWQDLPTIWYTVKAWGRLARAIRASVEKGNALIISGQPRLEQWQDDNGQTREEYAIHITRAAIDLAAGNYVWKRQVDAQGNFINFDVPKSQSPWNVDAKPQETLARIPSPTDSVTTSANASVANPLVADEGDTDVDDALTGKSTTEILEEAANGEREYQVAN
ncbi:MAG: single-stranded DNA-binding protein [Actinomycetaceae bacterium]|nr:single-stranded DNA-binding protein [Actinomycetaceae bacterium]